MEIFAKPNQSKILRGMITEVGLIETNTKQNRFFVYDIIIHTQ